MNNKIKAIIAGMLCVAGLWLALPTAAQENKDFPMDDVTKAREMTKLINEGQLNLRDATALAEKHTKGTAIGAICDIRIGPIEPREKMEPKVPPATSPPPEPERTQSRRLIYDVKCFANERIQTVSVDGLHKTVSGSELGK